MMTETHVPPVDQLMPAMGFTEQDIHANRAGQLSEQQQTQLKQMQRRITIIGGIGFLILSIIATVCLFIGQTNASLVLTFIGIALVVCNAIFIGISGRSWMRLSADLRNNTIETITGTMERVVRPTGRSNNYILRVNDVTFNVKKDVFKLFRHQMPYHLYRTQHSHVLLSAEPEIN